MSAPAQIATLVQRLHNCDASAAATLNLLARLSDSLRAAIAAAGGVPAAVACLRSSSSALQFQAAHLLAALFLDSRERCSAFVAVGGVPPLVQLLRSGDRCVLRAAALAVYILTCSLDEGACKPLLAAGALEPLGQIPLRVGADWPSADAETMLTCAGVAINNVAHLAPGGHAAAVAAGVIPGLVRCLEAGSTLDTHAAAANALCTLSTSTSGGIADIVAAGGIAAAVQALAGLPEYDSNPDAPYKLAGVLMNLAHCSAERCDAIIAVGGARALARCLRSQDWGILNQGVITLNMLAHRGDLESVRGAVAAARTSAAQFITVIEGLAHGCLGAEVQQAAAAVIDRLRAGAFRGQSALVDEVATELLMKANAAAAAAAAERPAESRPSPQPPRPPRVCAAPGCGATRGLRLCGGCTSVRYCSEACSRAHWREHRAECRRLQAERAASAAGGGDVAGTSST